MRAAIIGAGISGLCVAQRLHEAGMEVHLFDKARGPAGRLSTRRMDAGQFDHGAQYFTARVPEFQQAVEGWCDQAVVARWDGRFARLEHGVVVAEEQGPERYVGLPRMSALTRHLAAGIESSFSVRIERVNRVAQGWLLGSDEGVDLGVFDLVVVAVPAPQAVPLLADAPGLAARASGVRMMPCHAVMAAFEEAIPTEFDAALVRDSPLSWVARDASKPGRPDAESWVLHSSAEWSEAHVDDDLEQVADVLLEELGKALGQSLPPIRQRAVHRWLYARPAEPLDGSTLWDAEAGIGACGDWTRGDRVEAAFMSGADLAAAILAR